MRLNTFQNTFSKNKKHLNQSEFWKSKNTTRYSFSSTIKIWKKVKINKVPDPAFLFRAAALFSVICYPLRGTNVFKIQNANTCKKYLNTKYISSLLIQSYFCYLTPLLTGKILNSPQMNGLCWFENHQG